MSETTTPSDTPRRHRLLVLIALLAIVFWLAAFRGAASFHPQVKIATQDAMQITFLLKSTESVEECEATASNMTGIMRASCPMCEIRSSSCLTTLDSTQKRQLSWEPLDSPSLTLPNGVVIFESKSNERALAACKESERNSSKNPGLFKCHAPNELRTISAQGTKLIEALTMGVIGLVGALAAAWATCFLIIRYEHVHAHLSHDHLDEDRPQRFHTVPTPRIGGLGVLAGLLGCGALRVLSAVHGEVKSMHTAEASRRQGAGSALLRHIIAAARSNSASSR